MKKILAFACVALTLSGCAGVTQTVAVQPDGTKIVNNSFFQQTAFGTDSRVNVVEICNPKCDLAGRSYAYQSGIGRAVLTQVGPSAVTAAGFAIGMNNLRPSNTNITGVGGNASSTGGNSAAQGGASFSNATGGNSAARATGGNSNSRSVSGSYAGAAALASSMNYTSVKTTNNSSNTHRNNNW